MKIINKSERLTTDKNIFAAKFNGRKTKTLKSFYKKISKRLSFPDYYGNNMDALSDCLCDLSWITQDAVKLYIKNIHGFLCEEDSKIKESILEIFEEAAIEANQIEDGKTFEMVAVVDDKK